MNQSSISLLRSRAVLGAGFMVLAGIAFAALNVVTQELAMTLGFPPASTAFWQYGFALILSLPLLIRLGLRAMKTAYPFRHIFRVLLAAFGVQAWVTGLVTVPIWQAIALVMTSPFFTRPRGIASFTDTTMMSPTPAYLRFEPPSTLMHMTRRAPELSATSRLVCIWIMTSRPGSCSIHAAP